jgi:hypothetical protein
MIPSPMIDPKFYMKCPPKYDLLEENNDLVFCIIYYMFMTFLYLLFYYLGIFGTNFIFSKNQNLSRKIRSLLEYSRTFYS